MSKKILVIPGDGIGPEVMSYATELLALLSRKHELNLKFDHVDWGAERWLKEGVGIPKGELEKIPDTYSAILFGALGDPRIPDMAHGREILLGLRKGLDLYVNFRPVKIFHPRLSPLKKQKEIDIAIFRENTQDIYAGIGGALNGGSVAEIAMDQSVHSFLGVQRIIKAAFEYAAKNKRKQVCLVDKSNAIIYGGSLWQRVFKQISEDYPAIEKKHLFVDVAAMLMVQKPEGFDVIVCSNLFGDILSDLGAGLVGGLGLAASANINPGKIALFEPVHGSAPDIVGQQKANPFAMFLSAALMLEYLGFPKLRTTIEEAVKKAIEHDCVTPDLEGSKPTEKAAKFIIENCA